MGAKLMGPEVLFLDLGNQNRKFVKLEGSKVHFNLFFIIGAKYA